MKTNWYLTAGGTIIRDEPHGEFVCTTSEDRHGMTTNRQTDLAKYILQAANNFPDLLAALKEVLEAREQKPSFEVVKRINWKKLRKVFNRASKTPETE